jgi:hypothetical protein
LIVIAVALCYWTGSPIGAPFAIVGAILLWWTSQIMTLVRRDGPYFVLRGAKEPFLNSLPEWDGKPMPRR